MDCWHGFHVCDSFVLKPCAVLWPPHVPSFFEGGCLFPRHAGLPRSSKSGWLVFLAVDLSGLAGWSLESLAIHRTCVAWPSSSQLGPICALDSAMLTCVDGCGIGERSLSRQCVFLATLYSSFSFKPWIQDDGDGYASWS